MKFSLILATIGRTQEVARFLASLDSQTYRNFELIVVDQNSDNRLLPVLKPYEIKFNIIWLHSPPGLSKARNMGIQKASGEIIAFPDDDCWYQENLLERVILSFSQYPIRSGYTGRTVDAEGHSVVNRFSNESGTISLFDVWNKVTSASLFLKKNTIDSIGLFDETLGVGAGTHYGAGEEMDYLIRAIKAGFNLYYESNLTVFHPNPVIKYDQIALRRGFSYGCGMGFVLKKHHYPIGFVAYNFLRPLGGVLLSLLQIRPQKAIYHAFVFAGRIKGYTA